MWVPAAAEHPKLESDANSEQRKEVGAEKRARPKARAIKDASELMRLVIPAVAGGQKVAREAVIMVTKWVTRKVNTLVVRQVTFKAHRNGLGAKLS